MKKLLFLLCSFFTSSNTLSCVGEIGEFVDSWTIIKAPATADSFLYSTESNPLYSPSYSLNDTIQGGFSKTLKQLWNTDVSYILFNDEPPFSTSNNFSFGHTKGLLALDNQKTGFWIQHSIPQFPVGPAEANEYLGLLSNAYTYGQNAFCISLSSQTLDLLAYLFHLNRPNIYEFSLTDEIKNTYSNITSLTQDHYSEESICAYHPITSVKGIEHIVFGKSKEWNNDLWSACVSPFLQTNLSVESWIRGSAIGPSCDTYEVTDVKYVNFPNFQSWSEYDDHSKWATSNDGLWTCHGDINRMTTQFQRGGGGICYKGNTDLLDAISSQTTC